VLTPSQILRRCALISTATLAAVGLTLVAPGTASAEILAGTATMSTSGNMITVTFDGVVTTIHNAACGFSAIRGQRTFTSVHSSLDANGDAKIVHPLRNGTFNIEVGCLVGGMEHQVLFTERVTMRSVRDGTRPCGGICGGLITIGA
jgi:hypothetical protein